MPATSPLAVPRSRRLSPEARPTSRQLPEKACSRAWPRRGPLDKPRGRGADTGRVSGPWILLQHLASSAPAHDASCCRAVLASIFRRKPRTPGAVQILAQSPKLYDGFYCRSSASSTEIADANREPRREPLATNAMDSGRRGGRRPWRTRTMHYAVQLQGTASSEIRNQPVPYAELGSCRGSRNTSVRGIFRKGNAVGSRPWPPPAFDTSRSWREER